MTKILQVIEELVIIGTEKNTTAQNWCYENEWMKGYTTFVKENNCLLKLL